MAKMTGYQGSVPKAKAKIKTKGKKKGKFVLGKKGVNPFAKLQGK